ncbi:MAG: hypothetical protein A2885_07620 [Sphingopyxis sp. RIFCSPHIGHO2_01_FULL_65_24]|nr:MAG: hypothetical protein A2885_07620 [Sphingopyxis sp. RIFCSPHIGHO2_01_FULL_65_24]
MGECHVDAVLLSFRSKMREFNGVCNIHRSAEAERDGIVDRPVGRQAQGLAESMKLVLLTLVGFNHGIIVSFFEFDELFPSHRTLTQFSSTGVGHAAVRHGHSLSDAAGAR